MNTTKDELENLFREHFRTYTWSECQNAANLALKKAGHFDRSKLAVDVENVGNKLGFSPNSLEGLRTRFGLHGSVIKIAGSFRILIDQYHYEQEMFSYPFTIAEEIGHLLLHKNIFNVIETIEDRHRLEQIMTENESRNFERDAKRVASNLVLPSHVFEPFVFDWMKQNSSEVLAESFETWGDLAQIIAAKIHKKLSVSAIIVERALTRFTMTPIAKNIAIEYGLDLEHPDYFKR